MELLESLEWRYATKKMNGDKIPQSKLDRILEATRLAPSSYGLTPYRVIVVENQELKEKLVPACYGQTQLADSSVVLVFATWDAIMTENGVDDYINNIADQRNIPVNVLDDFKNMMIGTISNMSEEQKTIWAQKQAYIGLGVSIVASAVEEVDSTPMEGFVPAQVDKILRLKDMGLSSAVILTLGYRDTEGDSLSTMKKIRRDNLFIRI